MNKVTDTMLAVVLTLASLWLVLNMSERMLTLQTAATGSWASLSQLQSHSWEVWGSSRLVGQCSEVPACF